jgi:hypothetical protein
MDTQNQQPEFEVIGGDDPSDELLESLADLLLAIVDADENQRERSNQEV